MIKKITSIIALALLSTQMTQAQEYFSDDFSDGDASDWSIVDQDEDGYVWSVEDLSAAVATFDNSLVSFSWVNTDPDDPNVGDPLNPDNFAISPAIDLTNASGSIVLTFNYGTAASANFVADNFSVYVSTTNDHTAIMNETPIHTETLDFQGSESKLFDLSSYAGQTVYVTFRHHDVTDMYSMIIDDVVVRDAEEGELSNEEFSLSNFSIFPNPVEDKINLSFETLGEYNVVLSDILGREVRNVKVSNLSNSSIDVSDLKSGNYILNVYSDDKSFSKKVVIK
ncbi:T9SS-dependent choice-of-anchor J family protein [Aureivirga sp. CE67]|uniref:T9SS-dependent choice-of-anchor J family protein n=1 Tax=Aureivirga sp. CE67 TaxID=1788983 RepID=UPI0018CB7AC2|nr:choice-of-anchor J domain-containing protein [Aureivirga sp. CE67]